MVTILEETTKKPITLIGKRAGICWNGDITDDEKNYKRGMDCILSNHGRTLEFVNIEMILDGYSARVIREWYTHIGGSPTRLQASTRYIDYNNFEYIIPESVQDTKEKYDTYIDCMINISKACNKLSELGASKEDIANLLPLGMTTKIVDRRNLRNLVDMSHQRKCKRTYWEYRELFTDLENALKKYSEEWEWIVDNLFKSKCALFGKCTEKKPCFLDDKKIREITFND